ncbi:MAG TPA: cell division protein FtsQ/DivIB [Rhodocyclaceae bacterium]|nr:cell division protein FtsQ/DivIB [Rhodocyclaceae bacterium]
MAKARRKRATEAAEDGFWDRPVLMNLVADVLVVFAVAGLAWAAATAVQRLPIFPLREVVVGGSLDNVTRSQIEQAARAAVSGNFFTIDLDDARAVFEKLPWVRQADVRRRWPGTLELSIEEHVAVARWRRTDGESRLVNDHGEVFAAASDKPLPTFAGPEGSSSEVLSRYREIGQALAVLGRKPDALVLSSREAWQVKLDDGVLIELGRDEAKHSIADRLARFVAYYRPALEKSRLTRVGAVDMRYPNGFALRPAAVDNRS